MRPRSLRRSALVPSEVGLRVVVVEGETNETEQISDCLAIRGAGRVLEFRHVSSMINSVPAGGLDLFVLTAEYPPPITGELLRWIRRNWPRCQTVVVCENSDTELEQIARMNRSWFFIRPVLPEQWDAVLQGAEQIRVRV